MFKLMKSTSIVVNSLVKINCQTNSSINKTLIRYKRQTLSRRPFKVLTETGKDYYQQNDYEEDITPPELELKPKFMNKNERKYFDEGVSDDYFTDKTIDDNSRTGFAKTGSDTRRPPKVPKDFDKRNNNQNNTKRENRNQFNDSKMNKKSEKVLKPKITGIPVYERLGDKNTDFIKAITNLKMRKRRERMNLMLLEGKRLIVDAINANIRLNTIFFSKEENLVGIPLLGQLVSEGLKLKKVLYKDLSMFSELTTSPGIIAIGERPNNNTIFSSVSYNWGQKIPLILIADNIRDPGNLGTLVRSAAAVGAMNLVLMKGCADVWEGKVLRSGAGAHFRLSIANDIEWPHICNHIPIGKPFDLFIAESNLKHIDSIAKSRTDVPKHTISTITKDLDCGADEDLLRDDSYMDSNPELNKYKNSSIASTTFGETTFFTSDMETPTVLVIGGETHGLSNQSYKLAYDFMGKKITIPLALGVDSLNSAVAAAVIMYEMKRQFLSLHNIKGQQM